jgi:hypothetical protein
MCLPASLHTCNASSTYVRRGTNGNRGTSRLLYFFLFFFFFLVFLLPFDLGKSLEI